MLDYILSRMVLLSFLLLILGLLVSYQSTLGNFFLSGAAKNVAVDIGEKLRSIALNLSTSVETKRMLIPKVIQAGPVRTAFKLKFGCVKKSNEKAVMGIALQNPRGEFLYVYKIDLFLPGRSIHVSYPTEVNSGSILEITKTLSVSELNLTIKICDNYNCGSYKIPDGVCG